jgi:hypothetical protein
MSLKIPNPTSAMTETATEINGFHMALNMTINAAIIADVPSVFVFILSPAENFVAFLPL